MKMWFIFQIAITAQEGESLTLDCVPPDSRPPADIYWAFKDKDGSIQPVDMDNRITQDLEGKYFKLLIAQSQCLSRTTVKSVFS